MPLKFLHRKGAFFLISAAGLAIIFMVIFILVLAGGFSLVNIREKIKEEVEKPSQAGVALNSFLESTADGYPHGNRVMKNIISAYAETKDTNLKNAIENQLKKMFPKSKVELYIGNEKLTNSVSSLKDKHETVNMNVALPRGNYKAIQMRFYS